MYTSCMPFLQSHLSWALLWLHSKMGWRTPSTENFHPLFISQGWLQALLNIYILVDMVSFLSWANSQHQIGLTAVTFCPPFFNKSWKYFRCPFWGEPNMLYCHCMAFMLHVYDSKVSRICSSVSPSDAYKFFTFGNTAAVILSQECDIDKQNAISCTFPIILITWWHTTQH